MNDQARPMRSDFDALVRLLRRRGIWIVLCTLVAGVAAVAWSSNRPKQYTATAGLLFQSSQVPDQLFGSTVVAPATDPNRTAATDVQLVGLHVVASLTASTLHSQLTPAAILGKIQVQGGGQSDVVNVSATDHSPQLAAMLANAFASQFVKFRRDADRASVDGALKVVDAQLAAPRTSPSQRSDLQSRATQLSILKQLQTGGVQLVQPAVTPTSPSSPQVRRDGALGAGLGILLGIVVALMMQRFDHRIRDLDELKQAYGLPLLGVIPKSRALDADTDGVALPRLEAEAFQMLRTALRYAKVDRDVRSVLVASASPSEGKSTIAWNLAVAAASASGGGDSRVLLIEADFHRPSLAAKHGLRPSPGLGDLIVEDLPLAKVVQSVPVSSGTAEQNPPILDVIPAGDASSNPAGLLQSAGAIEVLSMLTRLYGLVVIDTPPSAVIADAIPLMRRVGAVLLVGRLGVTRRDAVRRFTEQLGNVEARVIGFVANDVAIGAQGYGYRADYGAYAAERNGQQRESQEGKRSGRRSAVAGRSPVAGARSSRARDLDPAERDRD